MPGSSVPSLLGRLSFFVVVLIIIVAIGVLHVAQSQLPVDRLQLLFDHCFTVLSQPGLRLLRVHKAGALRVLLILWGRLGLSE